jgi:hypothetical protein
MNYTNRKNKRLNTLINSLGKKIDQLNKEEKNKKNKERPNTIDVICSQDDIERTAKRKK